MYLLILRASARSRQDAEEVCRLFRHTLQLLREPGYSRAVCSVCTQNDRLVLIEEEWGSMAAVQSWLSSPSRQQLIQQILPLIEGTPEVTVYEEKI